MKRNVLAVLVAATFVARLWSIVGAADDAVPPGPTENVDEFLRGLSEEADETIDPSDEHDAERNAATFPCNIFSAAYLERVMGTPMDGGAYSLVNRTEDASNWKSDACVWKPKGDVAGAADLWISQAKHFDATHVECYAPPEGGDPLDGIGIKAWWRFQKSWGIGTLRVCGLPALLEVEVARPGAEEVVVRQSARTIAQRALEAAAQGALP